MWPQPYKVPKWQTILEKFGDKGHKSATFCVRKQRNKKTRAPTDNCLDVHKERLNRYRSNQCPAAYIEGRS